TTAIADALAAGVKVTGVTVHLVDEEMDHGPIVLQEAVTVRDDDTAGSLQARLHEVEHRLLPAAAAALLEGRLRVRGDRATIEADGA
ncbi:MAG TPA: formyltransferase family protein, partial [Actinomycetota bacterium]